MQDERIRLLQEESAILKRNERIQEQHFDMKIRRMRDELLAAEGAVQRALRRRGASDVDDVKADNTPLHRMELGVQHIGVQTEPDVASSPTRLSRHVSHDSTLSLGGEVTGELDIVLAQLKAREKAQLAEINTLTLQLGAKSLAMASLEETLSAGEQQQQAQRCALPHPFSVLYGGRQGGRQAGVTRAAHGARFLCSWQAC